MKPRPHQLAGAEFLARRHRALLADEPRVGKTLAAIIASDYVLARSIDVVTTASGRSVWRRAFETCGQGDRSIGIVGSDKNSDAADVRILSWNAAGNTKRRDVDLVILDESHKSKNPTAQCTLATLGKPYDDGREMLQAGALVPPGVRCWHLTGTPMPHDPSDLWTTLRVSHPECLKADAAKGWPDVTRFTDFRHRYCIVKMKKLSNWTRIPVVIGGRNLDELRQRIGDFMLRRTQKDIGIQPPVYELLPLICTPAERRESDGDLDKRRILEAAAAGKTKELEMELGPLRRITGTIKAPIVAAAAKDELDGGLDKIVLFYWHTDVGDELCAELENYGVARIDGNATSAEREQAERLFREDRNVRVFVGQIQACAEAIDLSASAELWFVESAFTPGLMRQASLRITNMNQTRTPVVKVCVLEGTVDEALQGALLRLWAAINGIMK